MSSAILYLAIVAIWAVVLVPRWLRPRAAAPQPVPVESPDADRRESAAISQDAGTSLVAGMDWAHVAGKPADGDADDSDEDAGNEAAAEAGLETELAVPPPASRQAEMLKARRRLLTTLITLTVIAIALAVTHIDAYWIVIPPTVLLVGYLVLLREFAHIDAERARRAARTCRAQADASPVPAAVPATGASDASSDAPVAPGDAEIIDISGRIGDQVYDQYSDAANWAVGD